MLCMYSRAEGAGPLRRSQDGQHWKVTGHTVSACNKDSQEAIRIEDPSHPLATPTKATQ